MILIITDNPMEIIVQWICFFNPTGHGDVQQNWDSKRDHVTISHVVGMKWDYHWMCPHFAEGFFSGIINREKT